MLTSLAISQLQASALYIRLTSEIFGSHPLAPAALFIAKCALVLAVSYLVWSDLKWF